MKLESTILPVDGSIRLSQSMKVVGNVNGIPITETVYGDCKLPDEEEDTIIVVGILICSVCPDRGDLYMPAGRDKMYGFNSLARNPFYK